MCLVERYLLLNPLVNDFGKPVGSSAPDAPRFTYRPIDERPVLPQMHRGMGFVQAGPSTHNTAEDLMQEPTQPVTRFTAPLPHLLDGADEDEIAINVGLGLVAREAAGVEYVLHGIYVHLAGLTKAYSDRQAWATGGSLVQRCREQLLKSSLAPACQSELTPVLDATEKGFRERNRYLHGYWSFDEESHQWLTLKGTPGLKRPEVTFVDSDEVWELADRFRSLHQNLLDWDLRHFGEMTETEDGHQAPASVKRG